PIGDHELGALIVRAVCGVAGPRQARPTTPQRTQQDDLLERLARGAHFRARSGRRHDLHMLCCPTMTDQATFEHSAGFERGETSGDLRLGKLEMMYEELFAEVIEDG